jgi:hypothetical protein
MTKVLCQIRDLLTVTALWARVLYFSVFAAYPACNLGIVKMPIQLQSLLFVHGTVWLPQMLQDAWLQDVSEQQIQARHEFLVK